MKYLLTCFLLSCACVFAQTETEPKEEKPVPAAPSAENALPPGRCGKVMVLISWDKEGNIYKYALDKLGIESELINTSDMAEAIQRLDEFDLVMTALNVNLTKDLEPYAEAFKDWVNRGGGFCVLDGCNGSLYVKFLDWLTDGFPMHPTGCNGAVDRVTHGWVYDTKPGHPLRNFPAKVDFECSQWHCLKKLDGWDIVATCDEKGGFHPVTVVRNQGRGFIYVSSMQQRWSSVAADLRCYLGCSRLGLKPVRAKRMELHPGKDRIFMRFNPMWDTGTGKAALTLKIGDAEKKIVKSFTKIKDSSEIGFVIPYELPENTEIEAELAINNAEGTIKIPLITGKTAPYLAVRGPRYRNVLSASRRVKNVKFIVTAHPVDGRTEEDKISIAVKNPGGRILAREVIAAGKDLDKTEFEFSLDLPKELEISDKYLVQAKFQSSGRVYSAKNNFEVRGTEHAGGVIIDEDMTMLVDGKPFFPLVIYHLKMDQYPDIIPLGFNTVTTFQWLSRAFQSFDAAEALGLKVFYENNEKYTSGLLHMPKKFSPRKSMLMWYLPDEPKHEWDADLSFEFSKILEEDKFHPRTVVHYVPPRYPLVQNGADIVAPDIYYINKKLTTEQQNYKAYASACDAAAKSSGFNKPVMMVMSAFGHENYTDFLMSSFISIARDARGLMWYAWDEGNKNCLKKVPEAQEYLKSVIAKIKLVKPYLLNPNRRCFTEPIYYVETTGEGEDAVEEKKDSGRTLYGIVCGTARKGAAIIVNPSTHMIPTPEIKEAAGKPLKSIFEEDNLKEQMAPFSVRAFSWNAETGKQRAKRATAAR